MYIKFKSVIGALEKDYLNPNGFNLDVATTRELKALVVYAIESYLTLMEMPCRVTGDIDLHLYNASHSKGAVVAQFNERAFNDWGSLGRGLVSTWITDFDDLTSKLVNRRNVTSITLTIYRKVGVYVTCHYTL